MKKNVKKNLMYLRKTLFDNTPIYAILLSDHPIKVRYSVSGLRGILEGGYFFM